MSTKVDLNNIMDITGAEAALIADHEGNLIESVNVEYDKNIAAMIQMAFTMNRDLSKDIGNGDLEQVFARSSDGFFVANKLQSNHIIMLLSKDNSKLGMLLKMLSTISK
ncbi:roadblock/LC7 domain-containing protein [Abyssalbus ytuae]|uniref:Roadblock/LC7 domain-containing protein n=1 Tax=Abyssalbus ytuae TaxID=2926907 RepID=A0A9E6ZNF2_9FLAO|nr:roadblock/LC7 domain-containing protein [Abyssalbus ytuae]UOB17570.1 roadblock/LC7 domain-containing protein [Abyssalbus ytuae]